MISYTGWPRKNAMTLIVNFKDIVNKTNLFLFYWVENSFSNSPRVQTEVPFAGDSLERYLSFTTDRPHDHRMPPLAGDNHGWVVFAVRTGFALGHRASTFNACAHYFDENSCAISITSPKVDFRPRNPTCLVGTREKSRRASTRCDCRGKSR